MGLAQMSQQEYTPNWIYPQDFSSEVSIDFQSSSKGLCSSMFFFPTQGCSFLFYMYFSCSNLTFETEIDLGGIEKNTPFVPFVGPTSRLFPGPVWKMEKTSPVFVPTLPLDPPTSGLNAWRFEISVWFIGLFFVWQNWQSFWGGKCPFKNGLRTWKRQWDDPFPTYYLLIWLNVWGKYLRCADWNLRVAPNHSLLRTDIRWY